MTRGMWQYGTAYPRLSLTSSESPRRAWTTVERRAIAAVMARSSRLSNRERELRLASKVLGAPSCMIRCVVAARKRLAMRNGREHDLVAVYVFQVLLQLVLIVVVVRLMLWVVVVFCVSKSTAHKTTSIPTCINTLDHPLQVEDEHLAYTCQQLRCSKCPSIASLRNLRR